MVGSVIIKITSCVYDSILIMIMGRYLVQNFIAYMSHGDIKKIDYKFKIFMTCMNKKGFKHQSTHFEVYDLQSLGSAYFFVLFYFFIFFLFMEFQA